MLTCSLSFNISPKISKFIQWHCCSFLVVYRQYSYKVEAHGSIFSSSSMSLWVSLISYIFLQIFLSSFASVSKIALINCVWRSWKKVKSLRGELSSCCWECAVEETKTVQKYIFSLQVTNSLIGHLNINRNSKVLIIFIITLFLLSPTQNLFPFKIYVLMLQASSS